MKSNYGMRYGLYAVNFFALSQESFTFYYMVKAALHGRWLAVLMFGFIWTVQAMYTVDRILKLHRNNEL